MVVLKPNVVRGGRAISLGNNLYLMKGRTHSEGGIDIGKNPETGLEVERDEVVQVLGGTNPVSPKGVRVFSAQPILGGISPAQYILGGANPNQVFNAQEQWKKINRVNDDGTRKARFGTEEDAKRDSAQVNIFRPSQDNSKVQANRIAHRKSLEKFIKDNPNLYGINTADFVDFMLDNATMESNNSSTAKHGTMYGYYQLKGLKPGSTEEQQHKAAYKHLSNLFKNVITDADISKAKELGISQAQLLHKFWNQERKVLNYLYQGKDNEDGLGTKISEWGNNNNLDIDYSPYVMKAFNDRNYIIQKGDNPESIMKRYRGVGNETRTFNNYNKDAADIFGLDYSKPLQVGQELSVDKVGPRKLNGSFEYGGRKIARNGTQRSRKKMFSDVTKQIKQIAKQEENRNTPLPIRGEKPITPLGYDIASYAPIVGDAIQLGEGISDIKNRNYIAGAINLGLLALPNAIQGPVKKGIQSAVRKYEIKHLPGYQLKSLMEGNPLEKQLSKDGTISVNSIKVKAGKASKVEQAVIDKVLSDKAFAGKKTVDYNQFRKAIQDELITYKRTPNSAYESYGMERIGIIPRNGQETLDAQRAFLRVHPELNWSVALGYDGRFERTIPTDYGSYIEQLIPEEEVNTMFPGWRNQYAPPKNVTTNTYTFSSDRIPIGNARHYDANTLGHSRTYITNDEPDVLHVMESQSDWAQHGKIGEPYEGTSSYLNDPESYKQFISRHKKLLEKMKLHPEDYMEGAIERQENNIKRHETILQNILEGNNKNSQIKYLRENFTTRQIQENLKYAAEQGQTKMRYPTRETAAKIEGYPVNEERLLDYDRGTIEYDAVKKELYEHPEYSPEHESILKKYSDFPKQYKKLFKDANVRTIIDKKGNSWYEVDVPKNYLNQEWQYKYGGIHIKPSKRGTFTAAAKKHGMSVQGFARKVLANKGKYSSTMVKKANFARNASKWKHKEFGGDMDFNYYITKDNIYKLGGRKKGQWGLQDYSNLFLLNNDTLGNIGRMKAIKDMKLGTNSFGDIEVPSFTIAGETFKPKVKDAIVNNNSGLVAQNLANGIQTAINIGGNIGSYFINRDAIRRMRGPAAPLPLRVETLPTRVSTAAQEAALRENVAKQENLLAGNLSSSRNRLNATNQIRNQGIGLYNQLQDRKGEIERELITRDKLNRQGITNQNIAQVNQWRNAAREFENKRIDLSSENAIQHLIQGPADARAGERGFFDNLASNDRYRMTAFLEAIKNPDALRAMNSDEIKQLARRFGVRTSWLRSIGINI